MATTTREVEPVREEILEFVRKTEETVTGAGRKLSDALCDLVPGDGQGIRRIVDEAFDFTESILKSQREFVGSLLDDFLGAPTSKRAPAKPAPKRTTHKASKHAAA